MGNRDLAECFLGALEEGEIEALLELVTDDFSFEVTLPDNHPYYELRKGTSREAFRRWIDVHVEDCDFRTLQVRDILESESRLAIVGFEDYVFRRSGKAAKADFVWVFTVRDGKLASLFDVFDTASVGKSYEATATSAPRVL